MTLTMIPMIGGIVLVMMAWILFFKGFGLLGVRLEDYTLFETISLVVLIFTTCFIIFVFLIIKEVIIL